METARAYLEPACVGTTRRTVVSELDRRPIRTAFTTLIAGRRPTVSVAPPGAASGDWRPLLH